MKPIKIAQIGTGHDHASVIWDSLKKNSDCFELIGLAEPIEANRDRIYSDAKVYTVDELLKMDDLEAVVIEAGKEHEIKYAQMFADKGIPVQVDKPGSADFDEWATFVNTMKKKHLPFGIGYMYRFNPLVNQAYEMMKRGELGDIFSVEAQMSVRHDKEKREWLGKYKGGMMYYLGCHLIDMVCMFKGIPDEVIPLSSTTGNEGVESEDYGFAILKYSNGVSFVKANASEVNGYERRQLVISGTKGTYEIRPWEINSEGKYYTKAKLTLLRKWQNQWTDNSREIVSDVYDRYDSMMRHFAAIVRGEAEMMFDYDYEIEVFRTIIKACGAKKRVFGEDEN
ncbi:MAG: Gfo/Idh/MocA family oxidoreductase [Clostridiales bacterium]|nr:Gfo/Idh/MocA family oxidoreductase [Clostridiales bacterium]